MTADGEGAAVSVPRARFYRLDSTRVTFAEYRFGGSLAVACLAYLLKLFKVRIPSSTDDPPVHELAPFACAWETLPESLRAAMAPLAGELGALGFAPALYHFIVDPLHSTKTLLVTLTHPSGRALARVHLREWGYRYPPRRNLFVEFLSSLADGTYLWSLSAKRDMLEPPACQLNHVVGATVEALWRSHQARLDQAPVSQAAVAIAPEQAADVAERHHALVRDFHARRGVFAPLSSEDGKLLGALALAPPAEVAASRHPEIMAELDRLQKKQSSWWNAVLLLVISAAFFLAAGGTSKSTWESFLILIPVLLVHELGHYVAMVGFGYRNLRMFFIPFLGAAVSGQNYNVPGWKKAIVSLAGPVPGIILGTGLAFVGLVLESRTLVKVAQVTVILNGLNLLPVLPLDGGWLMHAVLFSRHHFLDAGFRLLAALALLAGSLAIDDKVLLWLGIFMLLGLRFAYLQGRIVTQLRASGVPSVSADAQTIPPVVAEAIIDRVKAAFPQRQTSRSLAQLTLNVFQTLNARPPGWLASLVFVAVQGACLAMAVLAVALISIGQNGGFKQLAHRAAATHHPLAVQRIATWPESRSGMAGRDVVVATFGSGDEAKRAFDQIAGTRPAGVTLRLFGDSLLVAPPDGDDAARLRWYNQLRGGTEDVFVHRPGMEGSLALTCVAKDVTTATAIEKDANEYLRMPALMWSIPPWTREDSRSRDERERHQRARRTLLEAQSAGAQGLPGDSDGKQMVEAARQGDRAEVARLIKEQRRRYLERRAGALGRLREDSSMDAALVERYLSLEADKDKDGADYAAKLARELGPLVGQIALSDGKPLPGADRFSTRAGMSARQQILLSLEWMSFLDLVEGPKALLDWLAAQGCDDFKYELRRGVDTQAEWEEERE